MIREFIVKNVRKYLTITDSAYSNQSSKSTPDAFVENLYRLIGVGLSTFNNELNNILIFLRAGRSLYIKVNTDTKEVEFKDLQFGKIRKVHQKNEKEISEFETLSNKMTDLQSLEQRLIDGYISRRIGI